MPKYHAFDTSVSLCVWDPESTASSASSQRHLAYDTNSAVPASDPMSTSKNKTISSRKSFDPANGDMITKLAEDWFDEYEGMQIIGTSLPMPFYLVRAGKDIFKTEQAEATSTSRSELTTNGRADDTTAEAANEYDRVSFGTPSSALSLPSISPLICKAGYCNAPDASHATSCASEPSGVNSSNAMQKSAACGGTCAPIVTNAPLSTILAPKPFKVMVNLSKRSFMPSWGYESEKPQDICINIYLNGEFVHSRYVPERVCREKAIMFKMDQHYAGRRVDACLEVPFVIVPPAQNTDGSLRGGNKSQETAADRWNKINTALLADAECWGEDENGTQTVMRQYLETLSAVEMPTGMESLQRSGGKRMGVIDVVVLVGKSLGAKARGAKYLRDPKRKLSKDIMGLDAVLHEVRKEKWKKKLDINYYPDDVSAEANVSSPVTVVSPSSATLTDFPTIQHRTEGATHRTRNPIPSLADDNQPLLAQIASLVPGLAGAERKGRQADENLALAASIRRSAILTREDASSEVIPGFSNSKDAASCSPVIPATLTALLAGSELAESRLQIPDRPLFEPIRPRTTSNANPTQSSPKVLACPEPKLLMANHNLPVTEKSPLMHPRRPKRIPQKRYRGNTPEPLPAPKPKRRRLRDYREEPIAAECVPASLVTPARRMASLPTMEALAQDTTTATLDTNGFIGSQCITSRPRNRNRLQDSSQKAQAVDPSAGSSLATTIYGDREIGDNGRSHDSGPRSVNINTRIKRKSSLANRPQNKRFGRRTKNAAEGAVLRQDTALAMPSPECLFSTGHVNAFETAHKPCSYGPMQCMAASIVSTPKSFSTSSNDQTRQTSSTIGTHLTHAGAGVYIPVDIAMKSVPHGNGDVSSSNSSGVRTTVQTLPTPASQLSSASISGATSQFRPNSKDALQAYQDLLLQQDIEKSQNLALVHDPHVAIGATCKRKYSVLF